MTKFDKAFKEIIGFESGYVNDPIDRGGETKYGISKRQYPGLDIANLTLAHAKEIYYKDYFFTGRCDMNRLDDDIAIEVFEESVNMGLSTALNHLQIALNLLNNNQKLFKNLEVDGFALDITINSVNKVKKRRLIKVLNGLQFEHYHKIVVNNESQERFFGGWLART